MREAVRLRVAVLAGLLPEGTALSDTDWAKRHATINVLALLHVPAVYVYALIVGVGFGHSLLETLPVAIPALLATRTNITRSFRELLATLALVTSSAVLVHLSGGYIELHFHFFVIVALVTLYQQWRPFFLAIGFVLVHHGVAGAVDPLSVFNHPAAVSHPWAWAGVHAGFIAMASMVGIANWKLNEVARHRATESFRLLYEGEHAVVERLQEAERIKGELVAAVSHEVRTPLTAILGFSETLERTTAIPSRDVAAMAKRINRQGRRLQLLVENLLVVERPLGPNRGSCAAASAVQAGMAGLTDGAREDEVRSFDVEVPDGLDLCIAPAPMHTVLTNLFDNAVKFGTPGAPIEVRATMSPGDDEVVLTVTNHGPEVPADRLERIFEPFVQLDSSTTRSADGVGLGLYIVRRILTANGGHVRVTSEPGRTSFELRVPAAPAAPVSQDVVIPEIASVTG